MLKVEVCQRQSGNNYKEKTGAVLETLFYGYSNRELEGYTLADIMVKVSGYFYGEGYLHLWGYYNYEYWVDDVLAKTGVNNWQDFDVVGNGLHKIEQYIEPTTELGWEWLLRRKINGAYIDRNYRQDLFISHYVTAVTSKQTIIPYPEDGDIIYINISGISGLDMMNYAVYDAITGEKLESTLMDIQTYEGEITGIKLRIKFNYKADLHVIYLYPNGATNRDYTGDDYTLYNGKADKVILENNSYDDTDESVIINGVEYTYDVDSFSHSYEIQSRDYNYIVGWGSEVVSAKRLKVSVDVITDDISPLLSACGSKIFCKIKGYGCNMKIASLEPKTIADGSKIVKLSLTEVSD